MRDGIGQGGAGLDDRRMAGTDLQHNMQTRTADEFGGVIRKVTAAREAGGPMKEHMEKQKSDMSMHLDHEKHRHEKAMEHHKHHMEKHHNRPYDTQHGHDSYKY